MAIGAAAAIGRATCALGLAAAAGASTAPTTAAATTAPTATATALAARATPATAAIAVVVLGTGSILAGRLSQALTAHEDLSLCGSRGVVGIRGGESVGVRPSKRPGVRCDRTSSSVAGGRSGSLRPARRALSACFYRQERQEPSGWRNRLAGLAFEIALGTAFGSSTGLPARLRARSRALWQMPGRALPAHRRHRIRS